MKEEEMAGQEDNWMNGLYCTRSMRDECRDLKSSGRLFNWRELQEE